VTGGWGRECAIQLPLHWGQLFAAVADKPGQQLNQADKWQTQMQTGLKIMALITLQVGKQSCVHA